MKYLVIASLLCSCATVSAPQKPHLDLIFIRGADFEKDNIWVCGKSEGKMYCIEYSDFMSTMQHPKIDGGLL